MGGVTNPAGQAQTLQQIQNFLGNLTSAGYSGKEGSANAVSDIFATGTGALYQGIAVGAQSTRAIPIIGSVVGATLDLGKGTL